MRSLTAVIDQIKAELPEDQTEALSELNNLQSSVRYTAPEQMTRRWQQLCMVLTVNLPNLNEDPPEWALKIGSIVRGEA